jgi:hypothetical protein
VKYHQLLPQSFCTGAAGRSYEGGSHEECGKGIRGEDPEGAKEYGVELGVFFGMFERRWEESAMLITCSGIRRRVDGMRRIIRGVSRIFSGGVCG